MGYTGDDNNILLNSVRLISQQQQQQQRQQGPVDQLWISFKEYLIKENQSVSSIKDKISYAKRFYYVIESMNAQELTKLSPDVKAHVMKALVSLSKYLGRYDEWIKIIKRYQLKWSSTSNSSMKAFKSIFDIESQGKNLNSMIQWIRDASAVLPHQYKNILLFNTLTGLRPNEAQKALHLVKTNEIQYVDKDRMMLKHYQFPDLFIRQTKNAYISIVNEDILEIAKNTLDKENYYNSLRKRLSITNNFGMNMYYCRKVFATYLRASGIEPEIIDLLQGRISRSVFVNHYYRPDINDIITNRIRPVLFSLNKLLDSM